jgi:hypothetical protein
MLSFVVLKLPSRDILELLYFKQFSLYPCVVLELLPREILELLSRDV